MTVVDLRLATQHDAEAIARIHVETWRSTYAGLLPDDLLIGMSIEKQKKMWHRMLGGSETVIHALKRRSTIFMLSDFLFDPRPVDRPLGALARKHDVIALPMRDPFEESVPDLGLVEGEELEQGSALLIDTSDGQTRAALEAHYRRQREEVAALFRRHSVDQVPLEVGGDPIEPLMGFFKLRERGRARG